MAKREIKLNNELKKLKVQEKKLDFIKNYTCSSEDEFNRFLSENKASFELLKEIKERINKIEFLLLSDSEKKERDEYLKKLKNKFTPPS